MNRRCPVCQTSLRGPEYSRKRQSYLTAFDCPSCDTPLKLANDVYLWVVLAFQVLPISILSEQITEIRLADTLMTGSGLLTLVGVIGVVVRFRYVKA